MNVLGADKYQDGCNALVPKRPMDVRDDFALDIFEDAEVDDRNVVLAEHPVEMEIFKGPAQDMSLGNGVA